MTDAQTVRYVKARLMSLSDELAISQPVASEYLHRAADACMEAVVILGKARKEQS